MANAVFVPLSGYREYPTDAMARRAAEFYDEVRRRRTVREFSERPLPREIIENCLRAAGTAPSGANMQPWHFLVVSDPAIKRRIRIEAEKEEHDFYHRKAPVEWLDALAPLVGLATGMLITAIHHAGLVSLTHTPSPMGFLNDILGVPAHERPFLILVAGYPAEGATVPVITKKSLEEIATFL